MPTTILFVRHAQGTHNLCAELHGDKGYSDPQYLDAELTPKGIRQTTENRLFEKFDAIYCSPMRRCRQTLLGIYPLSKDLPVIMDDRLVEQPCGYNICDRRLDKSEIIQSFPPSWDHTHVADVYPWLIDEKADEEKIWTITKELLDKHQNQTILVVCHGTWIHRWFKLFTNTVTPWLENC